MSLESTLEQKTIGGIPVWGLGVGGAAVLIIGVTLHNRNKAKTGAIRAATTDQITGAAYDANGIPGGDTSQYGLPYGPIGDWLSQNPLFAGYPVGMSPKGLPGPITNQQWAKFAYNELVVKGGDPTLIENALAHYLQGATLSAPEQAVKDLAERLFGSPPEGLIPINNGGGNASQLPAVTNLSVTANGSMALATWSPVPGALWYTTFWQTPHGSTGGYKTVATSSTVDLNKLNVQPGESITALVYPQKSNDERGPDASANATRT